MVAVAEEIFQPSTLTIQLVSIALVNTLLGSRTLETARWLNLRKSPFSLLQTKQLEQGFLLPPGILRVTLSLEGGSVAVSGNLRTVIDIQKYRRMKHSRMNGSLNTTCFSELTMYIFLVLITII